VQYYGKFLHRTFCFKKRVGGDNLTNAEEVIFVLVLQKIWLRTLHNTVMSTNRSQYSFLRKIQNTPFALKSPSGRHGLAMVDVNFGRSLPHVHIILYPFHLTSDHLPSYCGHFLVFVPSFCVS
jgi:hypothetical protein